MNDPLSEEFKPKEGDNKKSTYGINTNGPMMNPSKCFNNEWLSKNYLDIRNTAQVQRMFLVFKKP